MFNSPHQDFDLPPEGAPALDDALKAFRDLCITIAWLRDPEKGCPWDLKQDHLSLRRFMIEEAYEAQEAMTNGDAGNLCEELGDVLLQVVLNAQVALDQGHFGLEDVIRSINAKMRRRHPHVFLGQESGDQERSDGGLKKTWDEIKASEKKSPVSPETGDNVFQEATGKHPATLQAQHIGKIASRIQFDWDSPAQVLDQVRSEVEELTQEFKRPSLELKLVGEEIGDVYFSLAQLCRHLGFDPEIISLDANQKFLRRFNAVERLAQQEGLDVSTAGREALENLWTKAKAKEKG